MIKTENMTIATIGGFRVTVQDRKREHWLTFRIPGKQGLYEFDGWFYIPIKSGRILHTNDTKKRYEKSDWKAL